MQIPDNRVPGGSNSFGNDDSSGCGVMLFLVAGLAILFWPKAIPVGPNYAGQYLIDCRPGEKIINLRREPSLDPKGIIGGITCGRAVEVKGASQKVDNETWLPIIYGDKSGYIVMSRLKKISK